MARHVKEKCSTDPSYGCPPCARELAEHIRWGVVVLDKPPGLTSRRAADRVRWLLGADKVGHGGTLDPMVTGVLPVLLGRSTRVAGLLLGCDKAYAGVMALHGDVADGELEGALGQFRGVIEQIPPRRSRVKRAARLREVHAFEITGREGRRAEFTVRCQGGTYIRKLIHDLGRELGCGAHMLKLRRTCAGPFTADDCVAMAGMEEASRSMAQGQEEPVRGVVRPVEEVVRALLPGVWMADGAVNSVCGGFPLMAPGVCELDDFERGARVAAMTMKGELVGIGKALLSWDEILAAERGPAIAVGSVLMERDLYPRWHRPMP